MTWTAEFAKAVEDLITIENCTEPSRGGMGSHAATGKDSQVLPKFTDLRVSNQSQPARLFNRQHQDERQSTSHY